MRKTILVDVMLVASLACGAAIAQTASSVTDAVMQGDARALDAFLDAHVDVNVPAADGSTALHWAVHNGDEKAVAALIKAGADVNARTRLGATPLYLAALEGNAELVKKLLKAGVDPNVSVLAHGETPLMFAARSGNAESVELLLDAGANIEAKETYRETNALHWAAEQNHADVVKVLLEHGADPQAISKVVLKPQRRLPNDRDPAPLPDIPSKGLTAMVFAARENGLDTVKALLDGGAPINQQSADGTTPLLAAVQNAHTELATYLIEHGADVNLANVNGWNPLYMAVKVRTMETGTMPNPRTSPELMYDFITLLVDKGADVNARLKAPTEIHDAISAIWLKEAGATPLIRAGLGGDLQVIQLLLEHGADPLLTTNDGTTALMTLAGVGFAAGFITDIGGPGQTIEAMQLLLDAGVDINAKNSEEVGAIHGAAHKNFVQGIEFLADRGADLTAVSQRRNTIDLFGEFHGNTVLDWADGIQTGGASSIYNAEAAALLESMLTARGLPLARLSITTTGGPVAKAEESADSALPSQ